MADARPENCRFRLQDEGKASVPMVTIADAHTEYVKALEAAGLGCQSSSCAWWHKGGMVVNGPCRCNTGHPRSDTDVADILGKLRAAAFAGSRLAKAIKPKAI